MCEGFVMSTAQMQVDGRRFGGQLDRKSKYGLTLPYGWCVVGVGWEGCADYWRVARNRCGDGAAVRGCGGAGGVQLPAGEGTGADADGRLWRAGALHSD